MNILHGAVLRSFSPLFYERARLGPSEKRKIVRFTYAYVALAFVGWALFAGRAAVLAGPKLLGPAFEDSISLIPWVALGYTFNAVRNFMTGYLYIAEQTHVLGVLTLSAAVLNAVLNVVFIRLWGIMGAAIATVAAFAFIAILTTHFAVRAHPMPWRDAIRRRTRGR